jgi:hypothetical protein
MIKRDDVSKKSHHALELLFDAFSQREPASTSLENAMMDAIYFDLDGTLTDPKPGITRSIQYALQKLDHHTIPTEDELTVHRPAAAREFRAAARRRSFG